MHDRTGMVEAAADGAAREAAPAWRWGILAFAVASVIINGFDRQMVAMLKPDILADFGWSDAQYGRLAALFQLGSVGTLLFAGWFLDKVGLRWGYALGNGLWSGITLLHVGVASFGGMLGLRVALGASESIQTPAAVKSVASWFPQAETSLALGIVNAAPNVGAILVPLAIPALALAVGWRQSFVLAGVLGLVWVGLWLLAKPPALPAVGSPTAGPIAGAAAETQDDVGRAAGTADDAGWSALLKDRRVHAFMAAKVLTDQMWWLLMFWLPDFFMRSFDLTSAEVARPTAFVYLLAMAGALTGGWAASRIIARGAAVPVARMRVLLACGTLTLLAPMALFAGQLWTAALLIGIVLFAHQGFSTNLFATVVDVFPARRVASVVAIGALAGNLWGAVVLELTGRLLDAGGGYLPLFAAGGSGYLLAALILRRWMWRTG